jgi:hypothetical protein
MKLTTIGFCAASIAAVLVLSAAALQDKPKAGAKPEAAPQMPEVKPGPEHAMLAKDAGTWDATVTDYMSGKPAVSKGVDVRRMVGALWEVVDTTSEMGGKPFFGHGITGYDQDKKKFVGTWVDSMGTAISPWEGTYDAATKKLTGTMTMSMGGTQMTATLVTEYKDDNTQTFTVSSPGPDGKPMTGLVIEYKRRK